MHSLIDVSLICVHRHFPLDIMIFIIGPAFDNTVWASNNEIFEKSTPSTSNILSLTRNLLAAAVDSLVISLINIPCFVFKKKKKEEKNSVIYSDFANFTQRNFSKAIPDSSVQ